MQLLLCEPSSFKFIFSRRPNLKRDGDRIHCHLWKYRQCQLELNHCPRQCSDNWWFEWFCFQYFLWGRCLFASSFSSFWFRIYAFFQTFAFASITKIVIIRWCRCTTNNLQTNFSPKITVYGRVPNLRFQSYVPRRPKAESIRFSLLAEYPDSGSAKRSDWNHDTTYTKFPVSVRQTHWLGFHPHIFSLSPRTFQILFTQSSSQPPFKHSNIWSSKIIENDLKNVFKFTAIACGFPRISRWAFLHLDIFSVSSFFIPFSIFWKMFQKKFWFMVHMFSVEKIAHSI